MNEKKISPAWLFVFGTFIFTLFTFYIFIVFASVHSGIGDHASTVSTMFSMASSRAKLQELKTGKEIVSSSYFTENEFIELQEISLHLSRNVSSLLGKTDIYRYTGIVSFIFMVCAFLFKPRKIGFVGLPFGIISLGMAIVVM